ncbi:ClpP/crotonase [Nadsonia fulvescens var. elongata DSM 6958]|uniref:ClpP/crotonase n=1 Tax=Nadsonia fulvescens var. elongata DSM 6958 TaxID=857566 RepID=A0A1E3PMP4_9ASCO|nr:ClpP/crotonase [Nadsonia fulvescens var. elongata DSM 6958]
MNFTSKFPLSFPLESDKKLITISAPKGKDYYLLTLNSGPDNRFTPTFITAFIDALDILSVCPPKVLITTSAFPKFYSNGLDLELALSTPNFFHLYYNRLLEKVFDFPYPTIALINGHAFAAGFMVSACHDYRVMNDQRGFACLNELEFDSPLLPPMIGIFREKFGPKICRKIALEAHRFTAQEAISEGLVDAAGGLEQAEAIVARISKFVSKSSYRLIRRETYRDFYKLVFSGNNDSLLAFGTAELDDKVREGRAESWAQKLAKL